MTRRASALLAATLGLLVAGTGVAAQSPVPSAAPLPDLAGRTLTIYSGRSEELVGPLFARFTAETGAGVEVRYGESAELAALILEEGDRSPADLFFAQDAGALGAVAAAGLFAPLDAATIAVVPAAYRATDGTWTGVTGRVRVVAYSTERVAPETLPSAIAAFTDPAWKGRIGWVPTNASFQAFVTELRLVLGDDAARAWLEGILANEPVIYEGNTQAVEGIAAGEVDVAFVNHYYAIRLADEVGGDYPVANHFLASGDPGTLVNVAGVGTLASSDDPDAAAAFAAWLLRPEIQAWFVGAESEYPLVAGIPADPRLPAIETIRSPLDDLGRLADLAGTIALLQEVGALD